MLWASLKKDTALRQENQQRRNLIVLKNYFKKLTSKSGDQNPLKKRGDTEKPNE
jgi:hypothetical protein